MPDVYCALRDSLMSRRTWLRGSGFSGALLLVGASARAAVKTPFCEKPSDIKTEPDPIGIAAHLVIAWCDLEPTYNVGQISLYLRLKQSKARYVERVVVADSLDKSLGVRYFDANSYDSQGYLPYIIISDIRLSDERLNIIALVNANGRRKVYRHYLVAADLKRSGVEGIKASSSLHAELGKSSEQVIASPLLLPKALFDSSHCSRPESCLADGEVAPWFAHLQASEFTLYAEIRSPHRGQGRFGRFVLTDPVGRILGFTRYSPASPGRVVIKALTPDEIRRQRIPDIYVAKIADCPFVTLIWEDLELGFRRTRISLT